MRGAKFSRHSKRFVKMLDTVIGMLGPDLDTAADILLELGRAHHHKYGVKVEYFPPMGIALLESIRETLAHERIPFPKETEDCWKDVYTAITTDMTIAIQRCSS